mmetsp:Transcript_31861/g.94959  ORF Transcript_31861/g.94959 Transcript_31861/m.94959 type:complete len:207 (-) Transcript_31861:20-640(-)
MCFSRTRPTAGTRRRVLRVNAGPRGSRSGWTSGRRPCVRSPRSCSDPVASRSHCWCRATSTWRGRVSSTATARRQRSGAITRCQAGRRRRRERCSGCSTRPASWTAFAGCIRLSARPRAGRASASSGSATTMRWPRRRSCRTRAWEACAWSTCVISATPSKGRTPTTCPSRACSQCVERNVSHHPVGMPARSREVRASSISRVTKP